jgi:hypothetical protein
MFERNVSTLIMSKIVSTPMIAAMITRRNAQIIAIFFIAALAS